MKPPGEGQQNALEITTNWNGRPMKIIVTGSKGKLGQRLIRVLSYSHDLLGFDLPELDICNLQDVTKKILQFQPDILINAAAHTAVDRCEDEADLAYQINALAVRNLAVAAESTRARFIHFSTDFVFDGERQGPPYIEYDTPNPQSVYGRSKLMGEREALLNCTRSIVLRLSWLYGSGGWNFTDWVIGEVRENRPVRIVTDQLGCPTWIGDVVNQVIHLFSTSAQGLYHCAGKGCCSRYDWACEAVKCAGLDTSLVKPVTSTEFKQKAPRPTYSAMRNFCLEKQGLEVMRPWQDALKDHIFEE